MSILANRILVTDDVCPSNLEHFKYWIEARKRYCFNDFPLLCFIIPNYQGKENVKESKEFNEWYEKYKNWVTIGVHGYDHTYPPECERDNQEEIIVKALDIMRPYLSEKFLFRAPGYQTTCFTEPILKKLGFCGIAHQARIKLFTEPVSYTRPPFNTHCTLNKYENAIGQIWDTLCLV